MRGGGGNPEDGRQDHRVDDDGARRHGQAGRAAQRPVAGAHRSGEGCKRRRRQHRQSGRRHQQQAAAAGRDRVRTAVARDRPRHVHRVLQRLGNPERAVQSDNRTDHRGGTAALQALWVTELLTDDRELTERRVEDAVLEVRVVVEHEAEDRRQQQKQREQRQEAVVRDERGKVDALVVEELVGDGQREADHRVPPLERIDPRDSRHLPIVARRGWVVPRASATRRRLAGAARPRR